MILEICTTTREGILAAEKGKADRIELCSALELGGLTPSAALVRYAAGAKLPVNVLIRPRPGDFVYSPGEIELMADDIRECRESGADGVVIGLLTNDGSMTFVLMGSFSMAARKALISSLIVSEASNLSSGVIR